MATGVNKEAEGSDNCDRPQGAPELTTPQTETGHAKAEGKRKKKARGGDVSCLHAGHTYSKSILMASGPWPSSRLSSALAVANASSLVQSSTPLCITLLTLLKMGFQYPCASRFTTATARFRVSASVVSGR
ncbi:hypothetical protein VPH35_063847 [Triticum aestivum]|uniref:Uncharacterized protein n=1 Tax=Aegilops tauschii subsp. strangulata TaxID=200361 RepID=A0A453GV55_AEGTS